MLSSNITTSLLCSTRRFARSKTISDTLLWCSGSSSNVEYITSTFFPSMDSLISVTSSGRSSIKRIIRCISGLLFVMDCAICLSNVVLPAFGGAAIIPLCPFPIGEIISTMRIAVLWLLVSIRILSFGKIGIKSSNAFRFIASRGWIPLIVFTYKRAANFSFWVRVLKFPSIISPVFKFSLRICAGET